MSSHHFVTTRTVIQLCPCSAGTRALYRQEDGSLEVGPELVALAVCRVWEDEHIDGTLTVRGKSRREVCGVEADQDEGFVLCEDTENFSGYLGPGEKPPRPQWEVDALERGEVNGEVGPK